jgi:hypothetical protein
MSIGVHSYPELYTTLLGWQLYDQIWDILAKTGLAFLPFLGIVLRNIGQPYASQETKDAGSTSLRRMELDFLVTLLLIFFAVSPALKLDPKLVSYTPVCQADGKQDTYHPGNTGTTYDKAFTVPTGDLRVPIWWYAVISMSEGITAGATTLVSCVPHLREMVASVNMAKITDPELKQEVQQFAQDCYVPARTQYLADVHAQSSTVTTINNLVSQYGTADTEWPGSRSFSQTYYQNQHASQPVRGFIYQSSQDINADTNADNPPAYGTPSCDTWWNDSRSGLKNKLTAILPKDFWQRFDPGHQPDPKKQDDLLKQILFTNSGYDKANNTVSDMSYSHVAAGLGSWLQGMEGYPKIYAAAQAAPIIQAMLLMMVYAFLPLVLVFTSYKPSSFISGAIIIFSLIFWSFIWQLVTWTDSALMSALYSDELFSQASPNAVLADITMGMMIVVAPLFWFSFMGAMGVAVGNLVTIAFNSLNGESQMAALKGASATKSIAKVAASAITK